MALNNLTALEMRQHYLEENVASLRLRIWHAYNKCVVAGDSHKAASQSRSTEHGASAPSCLQGVNLERPNRTKRKELRMRFITARQELSYLQRQESFAGFALREVEVRLRWEWYQHCLISNLNGVLPHWPSGPLTIHQNINMPPLRCGRPMSAVQDESHLMVHNMSTGYITSNNEDNNNASWHFRHDSGFHEPSIDYYQTNHSGSEMIESNPVDSRRYIYRPETNYSIPYAYSTNATSQFMPPVRCNSGSLPHSNNANMTISNKCPAIPPAEAVVATDTIEIALSACSISDSVVNRGAETTSSSIARPAKVRSSYEASWFYHTDDGHSGRGHSASGEKEECSGMKQIQGNKNTRRQRRCYSMSCVKDM